MSAPVVQILPERPGAPDVLELLALSDAYMAALYPPESNHMLDAQALSRDHVRFFVARGVLPGMVGQSQGGGGHPAGLALGCIALVIEEDGCGEIKRLFVREAARGLGLGRRLLDCLEACAAQEGVHTLRLETGIHQPEAHGLYESSGYVRRGPFGIYGPDPLCVFYEKRLPQPAR
jgi:Acetyltransferases